jgi:hypothetical protein
MIVILLCNAQITKCKSRTHHFLFKLEEPPQNSKHQTCHMHHGSGKRPRKVWDAQLQNLVARRTLRFEFLHRVRYILLRSVHSVHGVHGVYSLTRSVQNIFSISSKCLLILRNEMYIILLYLFICSPFSKTYVTPLNTFQLSVDPVQPATIRHITALLEHRFS